LRKGGLGSGGSRGGSLRARKGIGGKKGGRRDTRRGGKGLVLRDVILKAMQKRRWSYLTNRYRECEENAALLGCRGPTESSAASGGGKSPPRGESGLCLLQGSDDGAEVSLKPTVRMLEMTESCWQGELAARRKTGKRTESLSRTGDEGEIETEGRRQ